MLKYRLNLYFIFLILFSVQTVWAENDLEKFARSPVWLRIYQYTNNQLKSNKSKIEAPIFFFSDAGRTDPLTELTAAIEAYQDTKKTYGTLKLPAACAYPARKRIIEKGLGLKFPKVICKDLDDWISRFDANQVGIDFAGAYSGNPASILGHTFLRYYNNKVSRAGHELLSYAVGFLAVSNPGDSRALYMVRGLTGQYPGYYQIEPFYMKIGVYNNSESRDIWEQKLNLSPEEVEFSLLLLWEYSFNSKIPYYFIDENCSYRLLSLLEVVRPNTDLLSKLSPVVLPPDTVRVLIENGLADPDLKFRSSILRRLNLKVENLSPTEKLEFEKSKKNITDLENVKSALILDALIDYWTYTNYRAETNLNKKDQELMEATFLKRAKLPKVSPQISDEELRTKSQWIPTYLGHKTSSLSLAAGSKESENENYTLIRGSYRMGAHALTDPRPGYEDIAAIEYLGFDIESRGIWKALLVDAKSIEPLNLPEKKWSWLATISLDNNENLLSDTRLVMRGGGGGAYGVSDFGKFYFIPMVKTETWSDSEVDGILGVGFESGLLLGFARQGILISNESVWNREGYSSISNFILSYQVTNNQQILGSYLIENLVLISMKQSWTLGYKVHF